MAVGQGERAQSVDVTYLPCHQHLAMGTRVQGYRLRVVGQAIQGLAKCDVGACSQRAVVGGVKRRADGYHRIVCDDDRVRAAGTHRATAERAGTSCIGFKVSGCSHQANRAGERGVATVSHHHTAGAV